MDKTTMILYTVATVVLWLLGCKGMAAAVIAGMNGYLPAGAAIIIGIVGAVLWTASMMTASIIHRTVTNLNVNRP